MKKRNSDPVSDAGNTRLHRGIMSLLSSLLAVLAVAPAARADDVIWTGGANGSSTIWLTASNWSSISVPTSSDTAVFSSSGTNTGDITIQMATANGVQPVGAIKLDFGNTLNRTIRNNSSTSNGVLVLNSVNGVLLHNESGARLRITNGVSRSMDLGLAGSGQIYTGIDPSSTVPSVEIYSSITNYGGANGFTKTGPGTLYLRVVNSFSGPVTNSEGIIKFNDVSTVGDGSGTLYMNGGYLVSANTRANTPIANPIVLLTDANIYNDSGTVSERIFPLSGSLGGSAGTLVIGNQSTTVGNTFVLRLTGSFTFDRPVSIGSVADTFGAFKIMELYNNTAAGTQVFNGQISGDGSVRRANNSGGTSIFTGDNSYSGGTLISGGTLLANNVSGSALGYGEVTVTNTGTLGGSGSIGAPVVLAMGGTMSPGAASNSVGNLSISSDFTLSSGGKYTVHITAATGTPGSQWDVITVAGSWIDAATTVDPITVKLDSLGLVPSGWNSGISRTWKIIDGGTPVGFDATHFTVDTSAFAGAIQGVFSFDTISGDLYLTYTPAADIVINVPSGSQTQAAAGYPLLTGTFGVLKVGNGEVVFNNAANDYVGTTKIYAGTGSISVDALNGSGAFGAASSAVLLGNTAGTSNATLNISASGVTNGRGVTVQSGSTGIKTIGTTVTSGSVAFTGDISLLDSATFSAAGGGTAEVSGAISGTGGVTKSGGGTVVFSGANNYAGKTRVEAGTLSIGSIGAVGAAPASPVDDQVTISGGTLEYTGSTVTSVSERGFTFGPSNAVIAVVSNNLSLSGMASGPGSLTKLGALRLDLNNPTNSYAGDTFVNEGEIGVDGDGQLGAGTIRFNGGGLAFTANRGTGTGNYIANSIVISTNTTIRTSGGTANTSRIAVFSGDSFSGTGGTLTFSNSATAGTNTFDMRIVGGGFNFSRPIVLDNGTGVGGLTRLFLGNASNSTAQTFSGVISGNGRIRRSSQVAGDGGTTILTGANLYSGGTEVATGTLLVNNSVGSGTGIGEVTLSGSGVLGGTGAVSGLVSGNGSVSPGVSAGTLTLSGGLDLSTGGTYIWELAANSTNNPGTDYDVISLLGGSLTLGGTSVLSLNFTNTATAPDAGNPFWQSPRTWKIVSLGGASSNPGMTAFASITNDTYAAGTFTNYVDVGGNVILAFAPSGTPPPAPPVLSSTITGAGTASATISWSAQSGTTYTVQYKTNLTQPSWLTLGTATAGGATASFTDTNGPRPQVFYRVIWP